MQSWAVVKPECCLGQDLTLGMLLPATGTSFAGHEE